MKRLLIILLMVAAPEAFAAFATSLIWEVNASGNSANGGGFDSVSGTPGTDYSLATTPQVTYSGVGADALVVDPTTNTDVTCVNTPFTSAHVGNIINVTSGTGFTVQRVQIMSVTAGVARGDKSFGTLSSVGGNGRLGGALANIIDVSAVVIAGNLVCVKNGADYTRTTASDNFLSSGSATSPIRICGYASTRPTRTTHGDAFLGRTNGNGPLITTNMPLITYTTGSLSFTGTNVIVESLNISAASNASALSLITGDKYFAVRCKAANAGTGTSAVGIKIGGRGGVVDCDATLTNGGNAGRAAMESSGNNTFFQGNRATSTAAGLISNTVMTVVGNTIYECVTGIDLTNTGNQAIIVNNTIVSCTGDGINVITGTTITHIIIGNMITDCGGYGADFVSAANSPFVAYNRTRDNTLGAYNLGTDWVGAANFGSVTTDTGGSSTDYTNAGADDYSLIAASPAISVGLPLYQSIGALQRTQTGGSAGQTSRSH